jgi:UDP-N-acetylmuramate dehydrogenase
MPAIEEFLKNKKIKYRLNEPGSKCTTLASGGSIELLAEPGNVDDVLFLIQFLISEKKEYLILGAGSNLIISDVGTIKPVIRLGRGFRYYKETEQVTSEGPVLFEIGGSMPLMTAARELSELGYSGLEFAGGIPASMGGAVRMNAGAHGEEMSGIIKKVVYITPAGELCEKTASEIHFSYRHSDLPQNSLILSAVISLRKGNPVEISAKRKEFLEYRKRTQPLTLPTFGSVFKNPAPDKVAGMLIEKAGLKGVAVGGAKVSEMHANWIVNEEKSAKSSDVLKLISLIKAKVLDSCNEGLEEEVVSWD